MPVEIRSALDRDVPAIETLLRENALPTDGVRDRLTTTQVAIGNDEVIGTAALEMFEDGALLRSVAVSPSCRGSGAGRTLVESLIELASGRDVRAVYLLTTTAEQYFPRFGFERIERTAVPPGVRQSVEFTSACPASAVVMRKLV